LTPHILPVNGHILKAIDTVSHALNELNVIYAILGGSACRILGSVRVTGDIDLVIALTAATPSAEALVDTVCQRPEFDTINTFGIKTPAISFDGVQFPIEIFDPQQWASAYPQYSHVTQDRVKHTLPSGTVTYTFSVAWLLREKIYTFQQRGYPGTLKFRTDLNDISFLARLISPVEARAGFLEFSTENQLQFLPAINAFLIRDDVDNSLRAIVGSLCKTEPSGRDIILRMLSISFWYLIYVSLFPVAILNRLRGV
jgi:hypothetical protein